jgi:hypothetical protein
MSTEKKANKTFVSLRVPSWLKTIILAMASVVAIAVYAYPFPGKCLECPVIERISGILFGVFGVTVFLLPLIMVLPMFFWRHEKVRKYLKLYLYLWMPILLNLALVRHLFEIEGSFEGIARYIFTWAVENKVDFLLLFLPILGMDVIILHLLGLDIVGRIKKLFKKE